MTDFPDWFTDAYSDRMGKLRCTRKGDRVKMVDELTKLTAYYDGSIDTQVLNDPREVTVYIRHGDAYAMIHLDGGCSLHRGERDTYMAHWNINSYVAGYEPRGPLGTDDVKGWEDRRAHHCQTKFGPKFANRSRNPHHKQKATTIADGFGTFMEELLDCLYDLKNGSAFEPIELLAAA